MVNGGKKAEKVAVKMTTLAKGLSSQANKVTVPDSSKSSAMA